MLSAVKAIAEKVIATKAKNNGKLPYGFKTKSYGRKVKRHFLKCHAKQSITAY
jgi:hypothetical protein